MINYNIVQCLTCKNVIGYSDINIREDDRNNYIIILCHDCIEITPKGKSQK